MKILIVEDDLTLAKNLSQVLTKNGYAVNTADSFEDGMIKTEVNDYDCIVLDINLPNKSGFDFLAELRNQQDQTPIIIATARSQTQDKVKGLDLGADDYLPKPIDTQELLARIRAVIRRNTQTALPILTVGELVVSPSKHLATVNDQKIELTAKEFSVLEYLAHYSNQIVTRSMLMEHIWGNDLDTFSNVIDVYIRNLRRKIEKHSASQLIHTIRGKGYILGDK